MSKEFVYLVQYTSGEYDEYSVHPLFVTGNENKAKSYCKKLNRIGAKLKKYYDELYWDEHIDGERAGIVSDKRDKWGDFNKAHYIKIMVR